MNYRNPPLGPLSPGRAKRRDSLPEYKPYTDTGCYLYRYCLHCPRARCVYDVTGTAQHRRSLAATERLQALRDKGFNIDQVAALGRVSRRTVYRHTHPPDTK